MASRGTVVIDTPGAVVVRIDHGVADSFSRSVIPTSTRTWRRARHHGSATFRVTSLAPDWTVDGTHCASIIAFGPTRDAAHGTMQAYLDTVAPVPAP
jgi:hypothetical protein